MFFRFQSNNFARETVVKTKVHGLFNAIENLHYTSKTDLFFQWITVDEAEGAKLYTNFNELIDWSD